MDFGDAAAMAAQEWNQAWAWQQQIWQWTEEHPGAGLISAEQDAWERSQGIPCILDAGRLHWQSRRTGESWATIKLRRPTEHGRYLLECRQCSKIALVDHVMSGAGLCGTCRAEQLAERKVVQAQRRIERRKQRSAELANRKGKCLVCSAEMTVARVTKTTCSDRCRKQWLRKGAEAFPLPETPTRADVFGDVVPIAEAAPKLWVLHSRHACNLVMEGKDLASDELLQKLRADAERFERLALLADLREKAPAVFLWELSQ